MLSGSISRVTFIAFLLGFSLAANTALAQDSEEPGGPREGYAWGETQRQTEFGEDPLRVQIFAGAGAGLRFVRNLDDPFNQDFLVPAYLDLGFAAFAPGGDVRFGGGLTLSTNLMQDSGGVPVLQQWALMPAFHLLVPIRRLAPDLGADILQLTGHIGVPIILGAPLGRSGEDGGPPIDVTAGGEIGLGLNIKFLAGFGFYVEGQFAIFGGTEDTVHPILTFDGGLVIDYEVL